MQTWYEYWIYIIIHTRTLTDKVCVPVHEQPRIRWRHTHVVFFLFFVFSVATLCPPRVMKFKAYFRVIIHSSENNDLTTWQKFPMFILSICRSWIFFSLANMPMYFDFINMVQCIRLTWIVVSNLVRLFSFLFIF